jgi:metallo-beta-lactamase class B
MLELGTKPMVRIGRTVWVARIAPSLWLHTMTAVIAGGIMFPANGLILDRPGGSLMIDTGYSPEQATQLVDWAKQSLSAPVSLAVATHFHNDRTGGIDGLKSRGIRTVASPLTCSLARAHGQPVPEPIADFGVAPYRLDPDCELFFPGGGHTRDNIVAWLSGQRVLFGGCFLKSVTSTNLGNLADAVPADWPASIRNMQRRSPSPRITVPGHGTIKGDPAAWTLALLAKTAPSSAKG